MSVDYRIDWKGNRGEIWKVEHYQIANLCVLTGLVYKDNNCVTFVPYVEIPGTKNVPWSESHWFDEEQKKEFATTGAFLDWISCS